MNDYGPEIVGHLKLAVTCTRKFLIDKNVDQDLFEDFFFAAQFAIAPLLSDDCLEFKDKDANYAWTSMKNAMTDHLQSLNLVHIPSTTRARWVDEGKEFQDPVVERFREKPERDEDSQYYSDVTPKSLTELPEITAELLEEIRAFDPELVDARYVAFGGDPAHPLDVAEELNLTLPQVAARLLKLEQKICDLLNRQVPTTNRKASPPTLNEPEGSGVARVA